jgi:phosphate transport system protein
MQRQFEKEINQIKDKLSYMGLMVIEAFEHAVKAFFDRDVSLAEKVIQGDHAIDMLEIQIEEACIQFLALRQPEARDLRLLTSALKINNDLERIGDLAVNMAKRAMDLLRVPAMDIHPGLAPMAKDVNAMLHDSLRVFAQEDIRLAREVCQRDDTIDQEQFEIFHQLLHKDTGVQPVGQVVETLLFAKCMERIADHCTNICEDVYYMMEGKVIKHHLDDVANKQDK